MLEEKKRSKFEIFLVSAVVVLSIILGTAFYAGRAKINKTRLLMQELSMFRSAVTAFEIINRRYPTDLKELLNSSYEVNSDKRNFVTDVSMSDSGEVLDPFGNQYVYDPSKGWVSSRTEGYQRW